MDKVLDVFWAIRRDPVHYLQDESIWPLRHFLDGYSIRMRMQGHTSEMPALIRAFQLWLEEHFGIKAQSHCVYEVVDSYSYGPGHALNMFYSLFEQFYESHTKKRPTETEARAPGQGPPFQDVPDILRSIRQRPELYIGYPHFDGVRAYLSGHERAGMDLGLPKTPDEQLFDDFKRWIEAGRWQKGQPRPWFKLVRFLCFHDCGLSRGSAYSVFFNLLDEFAAKVGREGLFAVHP